MDVTLAMANRLRVYVKYLERLSHSLITLVLIAAPLVATFYFLLLHRILVRISNNLLNDLDIQAWPTLSSPHKPKH